MGLLVVIRFCAIGIPCNCVFCIIEASCNFLFAVPLKFSSDCMQRALEFEANYKRVSISLHIHIFVLDIHTQGL